jgi:hypothetical protein
MIVCLWVRYSAVRHVVNPSMALALKFHLLPRMGKWLMYSNIDSIHDRAMHRGRRSMRYYRSIQCTGAVLKG